METTIVTAFFDINREKSQVKGMKRSVSQYVEYFKRWAKMRNRLIVYTYPELAEEIRKIRKEYGLEDKTEIVTIPDIYEIEKDIFKKMLEIENKNEWSSLRLHVNAMSNGAKYNYIMLMKYRLVKDAKDRFMIEGIIAWMDFGFDHGGCCYLNEDEFDFYWKPEVNKNKVLIYVLKNPDKLNPVITLMTQSDCIMGCLLLLDADKADELWNICAKAAEALLMLSAIDDDQQILLMAYKYNPDLFEIRESTWFMPLKENGGSHFTVKAVNNKTKKINIKYKLICMASDIKHTLMNDYSRPIVKDYLIRLRRIFKEYLK